MNVKFLINISILIMTNFNILSFDIEILMIYNLYKEDIMEFILTVIAVIVMCSFLFIEWERWYIIPVVLLNGGPIAYITGTSPSIVGYFVTLLIAIYIGNELYTMLYR